MSCVRNSGTTDEVSESITSERVPGAREKGKPMQWYWEAGHYKPVVGELVVARMLGNDKGSNPAPPGFGVRLTPQNVETQLSEVRESQRRYAADRGEEIRALENLAQTIRTKLAERSSKAR